MKKLKNILPPHIGRLRLIVERKNDPDVKARLQGIDASIFARYEEFELAVRDSTLHSMAEDGVLQASEADLRGCYGSKTKGLATILDGIRNVQPERLLEKCPYCGITIPTTHDHYLPAGRFPELAVHGLNLVPCCSSCNGIKGERWKSAARRLFIHYYSDAIPDASFVVTELIPTPGNQSLGARFSLRRPAATLADDWMLIETHFDRLKLLDRYKDAANEEIANALGICVDHICEGGTDAAAFLARSERRIAATFGVGHWRASLYRELAASPIFLEMVTKKAALENGG